MFFHLPQSICTARIRFPNLISCIDPHYGHRAAANKTGSNPVSCTGGNIWEVRAAGARRAS
jgi:hypothetical protein